MTVCGEGKLSSLSPCHAGMLADNRTPVGSAEIIYVIFLVIQEHSHHANFAYSSAW
jgi:hypothetical protein